MIIRKFKASVLVVTLIVLGIILVTALSVSLTSMKNKTASMSESKTGVAFQNAQSGIELAMDAILEKIKITGNPVLYTADNLSGFSCNPPVSPGIYAKLTPTDTTLDGKFEVEMKGNNDAATTCSTYVIDIAAIKSVGSDAGQKRAIEAVVASTSGPDWQSDWNRIQDTDGYWGGTTGGAYSSGAGWYPSDCMAWFKDDSAGDCSSISGTRYPIGCLNNLVGSATGHGWSVNGTSIKMDIKQGTPLMSYWNGSSWETKSEGCIKVMLWK